MERPRWCGECGEMIHPDEAGFEEFEEFVGWPYHAECLVLAA